MFLIAGGEFQVLTDLLLIGKQKRYFDVEASKCSKVSKEEKEMAHLYERRKFPYPGDEEATEQFIASGGTIGTTIGPKGIIESGEDADNFQKKLQSKKFEQESLKLWLRMRNEVLSELQEKGYDVE